MNVPRRSVNVLVAAGFVLVIAILVASHGGGSPPPPPLPGTGTVPRSDDPFAFASGREAQFVARAIAGSGQPLFTKSPGGALTTAARVAALTPEITAATRGSGIDPGAIEGIVFVESAGNQYALAGSDPSSAGGLTQILASTATSLLGMHVDLAADRRLLAALRTAGSDAQAKSLLRRLARADQRFDPRAALAATVRYLQTAGRRFGRPDLAVVSYHMGIGNLTNVLDTYDGGSSVPYAQLYFDTAPDRHAATFRLLSGFGDQSSLYFWRVRGAEQIMRLYRSDPSALKRLNALQTAGDSTAPVLQPPGSTPSFADPNALSAAYAGRALVPLPANLSALGVRQAIPSGRRSVPAALYRGLRPAALDLLLELSARVRALSGGAGPLTLVGAVSDQGSVSHTSGDPLATTGYQFVLGRRYVSRAQAAALQVMLDRLQTLNLIGWARRGNTIAVTVARDAGTVITHGV